MVKKLIREPNKKFAPIYAFKIGLRDGQMKKAWKQNLIPLGEFGIFSFSIPFDPNKS